MAGRVRFGVLGCGIVGDVHAKSIASVPGAHLVAEADTAPDRARSLADRYRVTAYAGLQEMLDREQLDVVNICTPSGLHGEHAVQVMRAGRHVMVEKPMEISRAGIDEMLAAQAETGTKLAVIFQHRFDRASQHVRALVRDGAFGRLVLGNAHQLWWRSQEYYDSGEWRGTWELDGGGVLMNQAIHSIDLLQWLMGPVRTTYAYADTLVHTMEAEDAAVAVLRFASGALGTVIGTTAAYPGVTARVELFGDRGSASIEDDRLGFLHLSRDDEGETHGLAPRTEMSRADRLQDTFTTANPAALFIEGHAAQVADMVRAIREDGIPLVDGQEGRRAVDIILGIYESARTGREVVVHE